VRRQRQQHASDVKRACAKRAAIEPVAHLGRPWHGVDQVLEQRSAQLLVGAEQALGGLAEHRFGGSAEDFVGQMPTRLAERLVARAAFLAVPHRLVDDRDGCQDRDLLESEDQVRQVGNRPMPVLKVEGVEELLRFLRTQLLDAFQHALARARVFGQRIRLYFGRNADYRIDAPGWIEVRFRSRADRGHRLGWHRHHQSIRLDRQVGPCRP